MSKSPKKVGRPRVNLPVVMELLEEAFKINATIEQACSRAGIDPKTYYNLRKDNEVFSRKMDAARNYTSLKAKNNVGVAIDKGDLATSKWHLEKTDYNQPTNQTNVQVNIPTFNVMSEEAKNQLEKLYEGSDSTND